MTEFNIGDKVNISKSDLTYNNRSWVYKYARKYYRKWKTQCIRNYSPYIGTCEIVNKFLHPNSKTLIYIVKDNIGRIFIVDYDGVY